MRSRVLSPPLANLLSGFVIVAIAAILCLPFLLVGIPWGYDATTHMTYQFHFSRQFWGGEVYPRWLAEDNKGYGSPVFLVQYPFPYFVTALLRPILSFAPNATRESRELGVYCFLALAAAGLAAWVWFHNRCTPVASTIAAVAYISLPYTVGQVLYSRVAIGELTALIWMPLILAFCDRVEPGRFGIPVAIGAVFALLVMSNVLYAGLFVPVIVLYAAGVGKRAVLPVLLALTLGICMAAVYAVPLVAYKHFFDAGAVIRYHDIVALGHHLLFITPSQVHSYPFAIPGIVTAACLILLVAWYVWRADGGLAARLGMLLVLGLGIVLLVPNTGPALITLSRLKVSSFDSFDAYSAKMLFTALFTLGLGLLAYCRVSGDRADPRESALAVVACAFFVLMLPWSAAIWKIVPGIEIIQFPWRLCAILNVAAAGLFAAGVDDCLRPGVTPERRPSLPVMIVAAITVIVAGNIGWQFYKRLQPLATPGIDASRWIDPMYVTYVSPSGLAGFAKRVGTSPDSFEIAPTPVEAGVRATCAGGNGVASVVRARAGELLVSPHCQGEGRLEISQLYSPVWRIAGNTGFARDEALAGSADGLIEVSLPSRQDDFELVFGGWPERVGVIVSVTSILVAACISGFAGLRGRQRG